MAFKQVLTVTIWDILRRWADHQPLTTIAASVGCDRKTVRSYIALARAMGLSPGDRAGLSADPRQSHCSDAPGTPYGGDLPFGQRPREPP
jgi:hypothetical protein